MYLSKSPGLWGGKKRRDRNGWSLPGLIFHSFLETWHSRRILFAGIADNTVLMSLQSGHQLLPVASACPMYRTNRFATGCSYTHTFIFSCLLQLYSCLLLRVLLHTHEASHVYVPHVLMTSHVHVCVHVHMYTTGVHVLY